MADISTRKAASSAAVVLFLVSCLAHGQHTNAKQDEINTSEYEIFSAFIEQAFVGKAGAERVALPVSRVIIRSSGSPWWVSDNGTGLSTLYDASGVPQSLVVTIPVPSGQSGPATPTGNVFNFTVAFNVKPGAKAFWSNWSGYSG
jgi:hypothetical protein